MTTAALSELQVIRLCFGTAHHEDCTDNLACINYELLFSRVFFITGCFLIIHMIATPLWRNNFQNRFKTERNSRPKITPSVPDRMLSAKLIPARSYSPPRSHSIQSNTHTEKILMLYKRFRNESGQHLQGLRNMTVRIRALVKNLQQLSLFP